MFLKLFRYSFILLRGFFLMAFLLTSVACASVNSDRVAPAFNIALESITGVLFGYSGPIITREIVESIPYASVMVKIGKGTNGLLILESKTDNRFAWVSKDNVYIEITRPNMCFVQVFDKIEGIVS